MNLIVVALVTHSGFFSQLSGTVLPGFRKNQPEFSRPLKEDILRFGILKNYTFIVLTIMSTTQFFSGVIVLNLVTTTYRSAYLLVNQSSKFTKT